jgi:plastocyanin
MKKIYKSFLLLFCILLANQIKAATHNISVLSSSFSPNSISVNVGDSIVWLFSGGFHTTTSTSVPSGATSWDNPITSSVTSFTYVITVEGTYNYVCTVHGFSGQFVAVNTGIKTPAGFGGFNLSYIRPAVFKVDYTLNHSSEVKISLYDVTGKSVKVFLASRQVAGDYNQTFYLDDLQKGIYIVEMLIDNQRLPKRLIVD